jgi:hypothetical protein
MSESRAKLEQILELLLAEDNSRAEELLHEYVVAKARTEYERVLEAEDLVDQTNDFVDDISTDEEEIQSDETGFGRSDKEEGDHGYDGDGDDDSDLESKVGELEDELEALRRQFEELMSGEEGAGGGSDFEEFDLEDLEDDEDGEDGEEDDEDDEYDEYDEDFMKESTQFSNKVPEPKPGVSDPKAGASPFTKPPAHTKISSQGSPVKNRDGGEGKSNHGGNLTTQNPTRANINVDHKRAPAAINGENHSDSKGRASPLTKAPR